LSSATVNIHWEQVCRLLVHPLKIEIVEALAQVDRPISPSELHAEFVRADPSVTLQSVNYHLVSLTDAQVTVTVDVDTPPTGTPEKTFYALAPGVRA
jgi:DNA-binding transcriptional ArsR family regulator